MLSHMRTVLASRTCEKLHPAPFFVHVTTRLRLCFELYASDWESEAVKMFAGRFFTLGHNPAFFQRLRCWFRQNFVLDFQVSEIIGPVPVVAKEQEAKLINIPAPFTRSAKRAPALVTVSANPTWMDMRAITSLRRLRRRKGWYDLRKANKLQAREERTGLLAATEL